MSHNSSFKIHGLMISFIQSNQHERFLPKPVECPKENCMCEKSTHSKYHWGIEMCKHMLQNINII